jgi:hypothetical protein
MVTDNNTTPDGKQAETWENPQNPEQPSDARDDEQLQRQYEEAKRRKENLTETDHLDNDPKTE